MDSNRIDIPATSEKPAMVAFDRNFTDIPELSGYTPVFVGKYDDFEQMMHDSGQWKDEDKKLYEDENDQFTDSELKDYPLVRASAIATYLAKSFKDGLHDNGQGGSLPIDEGHKSVGMSGDQLTIGEITDVKLFTGNKYNIQMKPLQDNTVTVMAKIAWYEHELENIYLRKYGMKTSVVFDFDGVFLNLALCQLPAVQEVPSVVVNSIKGFKKTKERKLHFVTCSVELQKERTEKMSKDGRDFTSAKLKYKANSEDPDLTDRWYNIGMDIGLSESAIETIGGVDDENLTKLCDAFDGAVAEEPAEETQTFAKEVALGMTEEDVNKLVEGKLQENSFDKEEFKKEIMDSINSEPVVVNTLKIDNGISISDRITKAMASGLSHSEALKTLKGENK